MRVVVTGGAGFIGANLCRALLAMPSIDDVVVLDDFSTGHRTNLTSLAVCVVEGSVLHPATLDLACEAADAIVHLAALGSVPRSLIDPIATHEVNATGTALVLEAARRHDVRHVIFAGSSSVYGANESLPKHEALAPRPMSPYAASKLAAEAYALAWGAAFGLVTLAFRFFNVYGPLQRADHPYAAVIPRFVEAALSGTPCTIYGDGAQSRDFTYVDTVTAVLCDAVARRVASPDPVNLAFGTRHSLLDVGNELESIIGAPLQRQFEPRRAGDVMHSQADCTQLLELFPDVQPVPLAAGLRATAEWMRAGRDR